VFDTDWSGCERRTWYSPWNCWLYWVPDQDCWYWYSVEERVYVPCDDLTSEDLNDADVAGV
jgi:hypothetical protein